MKLNNIIIDNQQYKNIEKYEKNFIFTKEYIETKRCENINTHIIIVGMGPAGLFAAWVLAHQGFDVMIIEQGKKVEERIKDIDDFQNNSNLNVYSNIHFGEGGAGCFSDGKLQTNVNTPFCEYVFETFVSKGADQNILYETMPHIGTDVLRKVIINMREQLLTLGVKILYNHEVFDFNPNNKEIYCHDLKELKDKKISYDKLILACGHSAKNIYEMLKKYKAEMKPKNFSVGVRIEHLQKNINKALYHGDYPNLPPASYKLVSHLNNGRSCYSFCMCPGGYVVNATSTPNKIITNGMSFHARNSSQANSALLVGINADDYYHGDILDGLKYVEQIESKAWQAVNQNNQNNKYLTPVCLLKDFMNKKASTKLGKIIPSVKPGYAFYNIWEILPDYVCEAIKDSIYFFNKKIPGFNDGDAVISAPETRTSSVITILRNEESYEASIKDVYVIGEGSGYSGGITTSCIDGVKCAMLINNLNIK